MVGLNQHQNIILKDKNVAENPILVTIPGNPKIISVQVSEYQSFFITQDKKVIVCRKDQPSFSILKFPEQIYIKQIACGEYHYMALTTNGELYSWGESNFPLNKGQSGLGHFDIQKHPQKIELFEDNPVKEVSCGGHHTIVICESDDVFGWGEGIQGQLGLGEQKNFNTPQKINFNLDSDTSITQVSCGGHHSVFLDNDGKIYCCGKNSEGQLGFLKKKNKLSPEIVDYFGEKYITDIACGWTHTLVLVDPSYIYVTGNGFYGQLGLGNQENKYGFTIVENLKQKSIEKIFAGGHHSWFLLDYDDPIMSEYEDPSTLLSQSDYQQNISTPEIRLQLVSSFNKENEEQLEPIEEESQNIEKQISTPIFNKNENAMFLKNQSEHPFTENKEISSPEIENLSQDKKSQKIPIKDLQILEIEDKEEENLIQEDEELMNLEMTETQNINETEIKKWDDSKFRKDKEIMFSNDHIEIQTQELYEDQEFSESLADTQKNIQSQKNLIEQNNQNSQQIIKTFSKVSFEQRLPLQNDIIIEEKPQDEYTELQDTERKITANFTPQQLSNQQSDKKLPTQRKSTDDNKFFRYTTDLQNYVQSPQFLTEEQNIQEIKPLKKKFISDNRKPLLIKKTLDHMSVTKKKSFLKSLSSNDQKPKPLTPGNNKKKFTFGPQNLKSLKEFQKLMNFDQEPKSPQLVKRISEPEIGFFDTQEIQNIVKTLPDEENEEEMLLQPKVQNKSSTIKIIEENMSEEMDKESLIGNNSQQKHSHNKTIESQNNPSINNEIPRLLDNRPKQNITEKANIEQLNPQLKQYLNIKEQNKEKQKQQEEQQYFKEQIESEEDLDEENLTESENHETNSDITEEKNPILIKISFTNFKYNHKIIFIQSNEFYNEFVFNKIQEMITQIKLDDPILIQSDIYSLKQFFKINKYIAEFFKNILLPNSFGYVVYLIHQPQALLNDKKIMKFQTNYKFMKTQQTKIGKMYTIQKDDIIDDVKQQYLSNTYFLFRTKLSEYINSMSYYELRTIEFKQFSFQNQFQYIYQLYNAFLRQYLKQLKFESLLYFS